MTSFLHIIGLFRASIRGLGSLLVDVIGMGAMANVIEKGLRNTALRIRKSAFERLLAEESYQMIEDNILIMNGAKPNETELQTAKKLAKTDEFFLVFPNDGQIKEVRAFMNESGEKRNDVFLIDKVTFKTIVCDIKTCGNPSIETIIAHLTGGVNQAPNLILDITGKMEKSKLIVGLRRGWSKRLKYVFLNYHGQWYLLDRAKVFSKNWIPKMVK